MVWKIKLLIFGATGAVGSSLAKLMRDGASKCHLIEKTKKKFPDYQKKLAADFSITDVLEDGFLDKIESDLSDTEISGIAYCVGSIDLKPVNLISRKDVIKSFSLNLFSNL